MTYQPHIHEYKTREVEDVKRLFYEYPVVGIINMEDLSAKTLQRMKKSLRDKATIKITKKQFMKIAMDNIKDKKNMAAFKEKLEGIPALIFTREEPFTLYKLLEKSKTPAPAKPGQKAPFDITLPAGPTPFTPGPMIGELGQLGIKTEVKEGKINIREDKLIVKEGEIINQKVAELMAKLSIEPMKLGLNLVVTYQNGEILGSKVLYIDEELFINNIKTAHAGALALAMHLGMITPETAKPFIQKAYRVAKFLAEKCDILTPETTGKKLTEAEKTAVIIKAKVPDLPSSPSTPPSPPAQQPPPQSKPQPAPSSSPPEQQKDIKKAEAALPGERPSPFIETKQPFTTEDMEQAERFLKELTEKAVKIGEGKKVDPKIQSEQDISKLINQLKDKKSRGEL